MTPPPHAAPQGLTRRLTTGLTWMVAQTLTSRVTTFAAQIALAWLLFPEEFGPFVKAFSVVSIIGFVQNIGLREILVSRVEEFEEWANAAFWISLASGSMALAVVWALAPMAGEALGGGKVTEYIRILAVAIPFASASNVPRAKLAGTFRFGTTALVDLLTGAGVQALAVGLALAGAGSASLVWPRPAMAAVAMVVLLAVARPPLRWSMDWPRWPPLLRDCGLIAATSACTALLVNGDYLALGLYANERDNGLYYFAFGLSTQAVLLVGTQLVGVLFPAFASLEGDDRKKKAFLRCIPLVAYGTSFTAFLQAALAFPFFKLVIDENFGPAAGLMQILCLGLAIRPVGWVAGSVMQAQRRFSARLGIVVIGTAIFCMCVLPAAALGGVTAVAVTVSVYAMLEAFLVVLATFSYRIGPVLATARAVAKPVLLPLLATLPVWLATLALPPDAKSTALAFLLIGPVASVALVGWMVYRFDAVAFAELAGLWSHLRRRGNHGGAEGTPRVGDHLPSESNP